MNNIIEDVENTLGDMEILSGKELMTIVMKHDMETANKVFEIYKKNQKDSVWLLLLIVIKMMHLNLTRQHRHILLVVAAAVGLITTTVDVVV